MNAQRRSASSSWLTAGVIVVALTGCQTYTAYLHLDPDGDEPRRVRESQREAADSLVGRVVAEHGFIRDPNQVRLQRRSRNSVQSSFSVISSYVPRHAVTRDRLTIASVILYSDGGFAVLIRDRSELSATPLVGSVERDLLEAFGVEFPGYTIRVEQTRWGPPQGRCEH